MRKLLFIACLLIPHFTWGKSMTLEKIGQLAAERSDQVQAEVKLLESEKTLRHGTGRFANPETNFQVGTLRSEGANAMATIEAAVMQPIPWPGKRSALMSQADALVGLASVSTEEAKTLVQHAAILTAFHLAALGELAKHSSERKSHFQLIRNYFQNHPQASPSQRIDASLIESQMRLLEKGILELDQERQSAARLLAFYLGTAETIEPVVAWEFLSLIPSLTSLKAKLLENNPDWKRQEVQVQLAESRVRLARLEPWGDLGIGGGLRHEGIASGNRFYWGSFSMALPLWNRGQFSGPAARLLLGAEKKKADAVRNRLQQQWDDVLGQIETSGLILSQFPVSLVEPSEKIFDDAQREFLKGRITTTTLLQTDSQVHETIETVFRSQVTYLERISQIFLLVGEPLTWKVAR